MFSLHLWRKQDHVCSFQGASLQVLHWSGSCLLKPPPAEGKTYRSARFLVLLPMIHSVCWLGAHEMVLFSFSLLLHFYNVPSTINRQWLWTSIPCCLLFSSIFILGTVGCYFDNWPVFLPDSVLWVTITNSYSTPCGPPPPLFGSSLHVDQSGHSEALLKMTCFASMEIFFFFHALVEQ